MLPHRTGWLLAYRFTRSFPELLICAPAECRHRVEPRGSMAASRMAGIGASLSSDAQEEGLLSTK
jgi:hypothetical protein